MEIVEQDYLTSQMPHIALSKTVSQVSGNTMVFRSTATNMSLEKTVIEHKLRLKTDLIYCELNI